MGLRELGVTGLQSGDGEVGVPAVAKALGQEPLLVEELTSESIESKFVEAMGLTLRLAGSFNWSVAWAGETGQFRSCCSWIAGAVSWWGEPEGCL